MISEFADRIGGVTVKLITMFTLLFLLVPLIIAFALSFTATGLQFPPRSLSLVNYVSLFSRQDFKESLVASLVLATCATAISLSVGIAASVVLVRRQFKGRDFLNALFLSPLTLPGIAIGVSMLNLFIMLGIVDSFLKLLIAHSIITLPYVLRTVSASLIGFDRTLEEASQNLGANEIETFKRITLPLIKPAILAAIILSFQVSFNNVTVSVFLTGVFFYTLPVVLLSWTYFSFDPTVLAASGLIFLSTLILVLAIEKVLGIDKLIGGIATSRA